ncbi:hypothetical protein LIER_30956 [Lithospermum erythrorhizon]|uniref:Uncharacterized protein n=1 Tax=Lithospermum erythrorhizon TaxID=34254 RepID=A0AAV3RUP3_LITER
MCEKLSNTIPLRLENLLEEVQRAPLPKIDMILGRCNGLVFSKDGDIFLWNPCTSYCQKVLELDNLIGRVYSVVSGFCYDTSSDDYIVILTCRQFSPGWTLPVISASLKTTNWRFPYDIDSIVDMECIVNNKLRWLASPYGPYYGRQEEEVQQPWKNPNTLYILILHQTRSSCYY